MKNTKTIVNMIIFGIVGAFCGYSPHDWHFWFLLLGMSAAFFNGKATYNK